MRYPQIVVCEAEDRAEPLLRPLAAEHRWLLRPFRQPAAALAAAAEHRPTVLVVEADPGAEAADGLELIAELHRTRPDAAAVVVSPTKLADADRAAWTAAAFDLGARFVVFPPVERAVLEDVVGGLLTAAVRRAGGPGGTIDLADGGYEA